MNTVSVVIPNHNYGRTLERCLSSVYAQSHRPHEVIVADDASTDDSVAIAERCGARVVRMAYNKGVSAARNAGAAVATGEILFFLDSDEALAPGSIANAVAILDANPEYGCVHGVIAPEPLIDDGPVEWYKTLHAYWWRARGAGEVQTAFFAQAAIRRSVFDAAGPFNEELRDSEDLDYSERLAPITKILLTERIAAQHDEVSRLGPLLAEQFRRSQLLARTVIGSRRAGRASLTANRPQGIVAVAGALATLPLAIVHPILAAAPLGLLVAFAFSDIDLLHFVVRRKGWRFLPFFLGVHLLTHVALLAGAAVGLARYLRWQRILTPLIVVAAVIGLGWAIQRDGATALQAVAGNPQALPLTGLAIAANLAGLVLGLYAWRILVPLKGLQAARIFFLGQLSKYLPGRVWGVVTHIELGRAAGVPPARMVSAYFVSLGLTLLTGAGIGLLAAPGWWSLAPAGALGVLLIRPGLFDLPLRWGARLMRRTVEPLAPRPIRQALALAVVSWTVSGLHLWALARAFGAVDPRALVVCVGAFGLATVAGGLSVVAPDGWGVREVALTALLATVMPVGAAGLTAVASRLVCVLVETCISLAVVALARSSTPVRLGGNSVHSVLD